jgi:hypothetical protein
LPGFDSSEAESCAASAPFALCAAAACCAGAGVFFAVSDFDSPPPNSLASARKGAPRARTKELPLRFGFCVSSAGSVAAFVAPVVSVVASVVASVGSAAAGACAAGSLAATTYTSDARLPSAACGAINERVRTSEKRSEDVLRLDTAETSCGPGPRCPDFQKERLQAGTLRAFEL